MLDLVLSDVEGVRCRVIQKVAEHNGVLCFYALPVPETEYHERIVWRYAKADWDTLRSKLEAIDWNILDEYSVDVAADLVTRKVLELAEECIPKGRLLEEKTTHPWVNDRIIGLVSQKHAAAGTDNAETTV